MLPKTMRVAIAQLPGYVPPKRDVPVHGPAKGSAQMQARNGGRIATAERAFVTVHITGHAHF